MTYLSCSLAEHSIDERHDGSLQIHFISVATCWSVQVSHQSLHTKHKVYKLNIKIHDCIKPFSMVLIINFVL